MKARLSRLRIRDLAMFALVAAAVAAAVVLIGRELDVGRQAAATREGVTTNSEPSASSEMSVAQEQAATEPEVASSDLTLTLTAPSTCEVESYTYAAPGRVQSAQDDGSTRWVWKNLGYGGVAEFELRWSVGGGTGPYTLEIDGESRDARRDYAGRAGTASLGCLVDPGETLIHTPAAGWSDPPERLYRRDPEPSIDSGLKTIRATVTDATGATADASVDVYVILLITGSGTELSDGTYQAVRLSAGETYRIYDVLFTVPPQAMTEMGDQWEAADGGRGLALMVVGHDALVWINPRTGEELSRHFSAPRASVSGAPESGWSLDDYFDALAASRNRLPPAVSE